MRRLCSAAAAAARAVRCFGSNGEENQMSGGLYTARDRRAANVIAVAALAIIHLLSPAATRPPPQYNNAAGRARTSASHPVSSSAVVLPRPVFRRRAVQPSSRPPTSPQPVRDLARLRPVVHRPPRSRARSLAPTPKAAAAAHGASGKRDRIFVSLAFEDGRSA